MPIAEVRSLIGDNNKYSLLELLGRGPATSLQYQADMFPIRTGSYTVFVSGAARASATAVIALGIIDLTGVATAVTANAEVRVNYQYNALSDPEITFSINMASAAGDLLAASYSARSLAANYARFFAYSQGNKTVDKDKLSDKLLRIAESMEDAYEKNITLAGTTMDVAKFDDSGTPYDGYDTAVASVLTGTS